MLKNRENIKIVATVVILAWLFVFLAQEIDLTTADLGRFLKNGEMIFSGNFDVLKTNFYSYTYPDYPFVNHHWLFGALIFPIWKIMGFTGLHLFFTVIAAATFLIFFKIAQKQSGFKIAFFISLILIPLIAYRKEIRPEMFSFFFSAIFFWILWNWREGKLSPRFLFILPMLEILWVNIHIYFFLGFFIIGAFVAEKIIMIIFKKYPHNISPIIFGILFLCILATFINPFGIDGALHPFRVYNNYGYKILEEQSVWFLEKINISDPTFTLFKISAVLLILSFIFVFLKVRKQFFNNFPLVNFFIAIGIVIMASLAVRNFAIFGLFSMPILAYNLKIIFSNKISVESITPFVVVVTLIIFAVFSQNLSFRKFGLGLISNNDKAVNFFRENSIKGPIFNNYDIGGYLIFHLFPGEKVFVDNRPEVYPASFFKQVYTPMQEKEDVWREQEEKYGFNVIFFYRRDWTPWAQPFLIKRISDPFWAPVFVDENTIIFLKRNELNQSVIERYELPKEMFIVSKN